MHTLTVPLAQHHRTLCPTFLSNLTAHPFQPSYVEVSGIQTPAARRERWRRAVWTIMMHNRACVRSEDRWYIHYWAVLTLAGGDVRSVGRYLEERSEGLRRHHDLYEVHPNMNQKAVSIIDDLSLPEDPLPPDGEAFWAQIDEQRDL
ncbi:hypothetical protein [Ktedonobacter sp. SOSP1-52]|uniref:hypothetical protein n=1 Tax=Ktedonobacter sp. SOSP1-52 TaxID=2778366 RepID=UPI0019154EA3|nr:hypothetical protein [Ktedonobacter sp. SOSP1-52]